MSWATKLRDELRVRAMAIDGLSRYLSRGSPATVLFSRAPDNSQHGNFYVDAWREIVRCPEWSIRLDKAHTQTLALKEEDRKTAKELDSSNSSDALLMNCFCAPGASKRIATALGLEFSAAPLVFGEKANLRHKRLDREGTEIDLRLGKTIFEAKLTEIDFTTKSKAHVEGYADFDKCFDSSLLPSKGTEYMGYQLIRNVLAAEKLESKFVVLMDWRRPDLLNEWWKVHGAIKKGDLRQRCEVRFWHEVAMACDKPLREFLASKYGI
jgi:hypothetical protein